MQTYHTITTNQRDYINEDVEMIYNSLQIFNEYMQRENRRLRHQSSMCYENIKYVKYFIVKYTFCPTMW